MTREADEASVLDSLSLCVQSVVYVYLSSGFRLTINGPRAAPGHRGHGEMLESAVAPSDGLARGLHEGGRRGK